MPTRCQRPKPIPSKAIESVMNVREDAAHFEEALTPDQATTLVRAIVRDGAVAWSSQALKKMRSCRLTTADCHNVLRRGVSDPGELVRRRRRYRIHTVRACVVVTFRSETELVVVSAWRKQ